MNISIQGDGKFLAMHTLLNNLEKTYVLQEVAQLQAFKDYVADKPFFKCVYVPNVLVNIVTEYQA